MTRYFKATFHNGITKIRSSTSRDYTHAYQFITKGGHQQFGFSTSYSQAYKNMEAESAWQRRNQGPNQFDEVVAVEEITAKEYRSKDKVVEDQTYPDPDGRDFDNLGESPDY